jgi:multidrug transporter EmrE-like cation transporter
VALPRLTRLSAQAQASQRPGVAMAVIMTGVLMTAVDTTIVVLALPEISRGLAFAIFVGSTSLHGRIADAFTSGLHAAFYASMGFMVLAAGLSALRVRSPHA